MTIKNYSPHFYKNKYVESKASTTSTCAADVNGLAVPVEGAEGFNFITKVTGGSALASDKYLVLKSIQFGNSDFTDNVSTYLIDSDYLLVSGDKDNVATNLKLAAVGNFQVGIPNLAINGQTHIRIVHSVVGSSPNIIWESHLVKTVSEIASS